MSTEAPSVQYRVASAGSARMQLGTSQEAEHAINRRSLSPRYYQDIGRLGNQSKQSYVDMASTEQCIFTTEGRVFINHDSPIRTTRCALSDLQNSLEYSNTPISQAGSGKLLPLSREPQRNAVIAATPDVYVWIIGRGISDVESASTPNETKFYGHVEPTAWRITNAFKKSLADAFKGYVNAFESSTPSLSSQTGKVEWLPLTGWTRSNPLQLTTDISTKGAVPTHMVSKPEVSVLANLGSHHDVYSARIMELRGFAEDDEDIEAVNEFSISDFWAFMEDNIYSRRAGLVLLDNGNLRAVWRENHGNNVGLEFQGDGSILYVMFKRHADGREADRDAGITAFDGVVDKLREMDLLSFVNG